MLKDWLLSFFGPSSRFNVGDSVQPVQGSQELMVVIDVMREPETSKQVVLCQWYDVQEKREKVKVFDEKDLEPFDWYHPAKRSS